MIAKKAGKSSSFKGRIEYCVDEKKGEQKGKLIACSDSLLHCIEGRNQINVDSITEEMEGQASINDRVKKPCYHQIFSFPSGEKPSDEILAGISNDFSKHFGFDQWFSVKHEDKEHLHIHFIGNTIGENGKTVVNDSNDYYRLNNFVKGVHEHYNLQNVGLITKEKKYNSQAERFKNHINKAIDNEKVKNIKDFQAELLKSGIKSIVNRGITFIDKYNGTELKGSAIGREYSLKKLEEKIANKALIKKETNLINDQDINRNVKEKIRDFTKISKNIKELQVRLKAAGIIFDIIDVVRNGKKVKSISIEEKGKKISQTDLGADFILGNIMSNFGKERFESIDDKKNKLRDTIKSVKEELNNGSQNGLHSFAEAMGRRGWEIKVIEDKFVKEDKQVVDYKRVNYINTENSFSISDNLLKEKNVMINPYTYYSILKDTNTQYVINQKRNINKAEIKEKIRESITYSSSMKEFEYQLNRFDILPEINEFTDVRKGNKIEYLNFKVGNVFFTSKDLGEDYTLKNIRANFGNSNFETISDQKQALRNDIDQSIELLSQIKTGLEFNDFKLVMKDKGWSINIEDNSFTTKEKRTIDFQSLIYQNDKNSHKKFKDYELKDEDSNYDFKQVNHEIKGANADLLRESLLSCLKDSKDEKELIENLYTKHGILLYFENKRYVNELEQESYRYRLPIFLMGKDTSNATKLPVTELVNEKIEKNKIYEEKGIKEFILPKISLEEMNWNTTDKNLKHITDRFIRGTLFENSNHNTLVKSAEFEPDQDQYDPSILDDLVQLFKQKTEKSGHGKIKSEEEAKDIRSIEEKRKDQSRRLGHIL